MILLVLLTSFVGVLSMDNGVSLTPPLGWSTWCTNNSFIPCYDDFCNEREIKSVADAFVAQGLDKLGYRWLLLDDCWAATHRSANNSIQADTTRFPSGTLKPLADYLHLRGLKLGAYTDVGAKTCRGGRLGSWPHYAQDAMTFAAWGLDMVKQDWCDHPSGFTQQQLYTNMSQALNATGRAMFFDICGWGLNDVWKWGGDIANSYRVGPDHIPLWWTPPTKQDPGQGQGVANIIQHMAGLGRYARPGAWNDPDFLMPGYPWNGVTEDRTAFSFWCLWAAPLMIAVGFAVFATYLAPNAARAQTDVRDLSNKQVILNKEAIAVNQDPLGIGGDLVADHANAQVWSKKLSGGRWAVVLYNAELVSFGFPLVPKLLLDSSHLQDWPASATSARVRDIWQHKDLGAFHQSYEKSLDARDSQMLIVTPV